MPYLGFAVVVILWVAFGAALVASVGSLDELWAWARDQPLIVQGIMWVVLLPWMAALAIWESSWVLWAKLASIAGIAWANLYMFFPKSV